MSNQKVFETFPELPSGARFYRCALRVNPFPYVQRYNKPASRAFSCEGEYNKAVVERCRDNGIEVIAVTDHYCVSTAASLILCAEDAGLKVFPGFEAVTKDDVHLLCLFNPGTPLNELEGILGNCGIQDHQASPVGTYDTLEFLDEVRKWGAVCIAAHVASAGGLLRTLSGQPRINAWQSPNLLACALPGSLQDAPDNLRPILENKNNDYRRKHPVAIINAQDVNQPEDLSPPGASCQIKMSEVAIEGLRQAFLDPTSRIRLNSDHELPKHTELAELRWEGGFLDGTVIRLNPNLNVLVGGRGTGKSSIIESLRYVLGQDPIGDEADKSHQGIIRRVIRDGTRISLSICVYHPVKRQYRIERTVPNPPQVYDADNRLLNLLPQDIVPLIEVYGQHEIAELARDAQKRTYLLRRFVESQEPLEQHKRAILRALEKNRKSLVDIRMELQHIDEQLAALPGLEETLRYYREAGVEDRLQERSLLVREERIIKSLPERLQPFEDSLEYLRQELPVDQVFLSSKALAELPGREILAELNGILHDLSEALERTVGQMEAALADADQGIAGIRKRWLSHRDEIQIAYETILRDLQKSEINGTEFIQLRDRFEALRPLEEKRKQLRHLEAQYAEHRRAYLKEWQRLKDEEFHLFARAARRVSYKLHGRVCVKVKADREPLFQFLRDEMGGQLKKTIDILSRDKMFELSQFVENCRKGAEAVRQHYPTITQWQAKSLAAAPEGVLMRLEVLELPSTTEIHLNTAPRNKTPSWRAIDDLSTGQKATAVLLLLLLESDAPLIVDQPEDDLDNRFITESVVPSIREEKFRRQFIFSTHNANIPVLGDAEMVLGLSASGEASHGHACIAREHMGSIDTRSVRELVEDILEGGKAAFEMRRLKYGF